MHPLCPLHLVQPGSKFRLASVDPDATPGVASAMNGRKVKAAKIAGNEKSKDPSKDPAKDWAKDETEKNVKRIADLQETLYAENTRALLVVLQAMDTGGKDGCIRGVFSGVNPQGCRVTSFKKPSESELDRDFLWRVHDSVPAKGEIGVFNRSHYEDVLIVRVHGFVPEKIWRARYQQINDFERYLAETGTAILKFMLHISKDEQKERLQARLDDPSKHWKFSPNDLNEREHWDDYQRAFEEALARCSTPHAPWYCIPSNKKWYRNWAVSTIVRETLERMNPRTPKASFDAKAIRLR